MTFAETLKRHETKSNKFEFVKKEMLCWWIEKDYIDFIKEKTLTEELTLGETIELILSDVQLHL